VRKKDKYLKFKSTCCAVGSFDTMHSMHNTPHLAGQCPNHISD